jgi:hypothetical protein
VIQVEGEVSKLGEWMGVSMFNGIVKQLQKKPIMTAGQTYGQHLGGLVAYHR